MREQLFNLHSGESDLDLFQAVEVAYPAWLKGYLAWEARVAIHLNAFNKNKAISVLFGNVSRLGDGVFWYVLMSLLLIVDGDHALEAVLVMALTGLTCTALYKALKKSTARLRPCQRYGAIHLTTQPLDLHSFPSGHTLHAVCFSLVAVAYYPALALMLLPFTLLVATSRLVLGLHYISDVAAAAFIGTALALLGLNLATLF